MDKLKTEKTVKLHSYMHTRLNRHTQQSIIRGYSEERA